VETVLVIVFLLVAVLLMLMVLIQRGRGGGLAGALGGAGGHSAFGTKTADVFVKTTAVLGAVFFLLALVTAWYMQHFGGGLFPEGEPPPAKAPAAPGEAPAGKSAPAGDTGKAAPAAPAPAGEPKSEGK